MISTRCKNKTDVALIVSSSFNNSMPNFPTPGNDDAESGSDQVWNVDFIYQLELLLVNFSVQSMRVIHLLFFTTFSSFCMHVDG